MAAKGKISALIEEAQRRASMQKLASGAGITAINLAESIPDDMSFLAWCEELGRQGMKIDGKPFDLTSRPALLPLYRAIPTTREEARGLIIVVQKATQIGITVWEVLATIYLAIKFAPLSIGLFLPDQATASHKSEHRFMRIVRSVPQILARMVVRKVGEAEKKIGEGNILTRALGESLFMFLWTTGKVSTESRPMDMVTLDEVQEMNLADIDKVHLRTGDSDFAMILMLSTANMPDLDINFWYEPGTREVWHSRCGECGALSDLTDPAGVFPAKSVTYNSGQVAGAPLNDYIWTCPACGGWIQDPQDGEPVVTNPDANPRHKSFLMPRLVSPRATARSMYESFMRAKTGDQKKSVYNRILARPYIDATQLPVTMALCQACVEEGKKVGVTWLEKSQETYMGVDQMGGFNAVIIKRRLPDGRQATIHVDAVFDLAPFDRCAVLMEQYGVICCVVEQLPNVNDARRFANAFPGRVFLASYADMRNEMILWGDALSDSDKKTAEDDRSRYSVTLHQYKCMQTSLFRVRDRMCLFPDPDDLIVDVIDDGAPKRIPILRDWVFTHFTKTALVVEEDEETRALRPRVKKVGLDPHYSFANMLCDVAWARAYGTSSFFFPEATVAASNDGQQARSAKVDQLLQQARAEHGTCGSCTAFADGWCTERSFRVRAEDPGCPYYVEVDDGRD